MTERRNPDEPTASARGFFDSYWDALAKRGWNAVVLHSWRNLPETIDSDVDYAVAGPSHRELLEFLAAFARSKGWLLVQVIEHEPGAFFCVCMQARPPFEHIQLDVTWNYRRSGHPLVGSELLFEGSRRMPGKSFAVPSPGGEFTYLLAKAAAKGKDFNMIRGRLAELLEEDEEGCRKSAGRTFGDVPGVMSGDQDPLGAWAAWFADAPCFKAVRAGRRFGFSEITLVLRRILQPTGFRVSVKGSAGGEQVRRLATILGPAFRHVQVRRPAGILGWPGVLLRIIRTCLVIEEQNVMETDSAAMTQDLVRDTLQSLASRAERRIHGY